MVMSRSFFDVICDAGPLIHLDELSCLDLMGDFRTVFVPEQVWREVERHRLNTLEQTVVDLHRVSVPISEDASFQALVRALSLDIGEQAVLSLAVLYPEAILLTDDAAAHLAAEALGYRVHGSIGILLRAIRRRQRTRDQVLTLLRSLPEWSSLHIRPALLQEIILQIESQVTGKRT
jgi:predicted nucleic acid-binding protein